MHNQSSGHFLSRNEHQSAMLPKIHSYLTDMSFSNHSISVLPSSTKSMKNDFRERQFKPFFQERDHLGRLIKKKTDFSQIMPSVQKSDNPENDQSLSKPYIHISKPFFSIHNPENNTHRVESFIEARTNESSIQHADLSIQSPRSPTIEQDKTFEDKKSIQKPDNISMIWKPNEWSHSKGSLEIDAIPSKSTRQLEDLLSSFPVQTQHKKNSKLENFLSSLLNHKDCFQDQTAEYLEQITRQCTESKKKMIIQVYMKRNLLNHIGLFQKQKKIPPLPGVGQYDLSNLDNFKFKRAQNIAIRKGNEKERRVQKNSLELFMIAQAHKKKILAELLQKKRMEQDDRDLFLPSISKCTLIFSYSHQFQQYFFVCPAEHNARARNKLSLVDEGENFDKMNEEVHKYQQEFASKIKWAQKKVQKIQTDLQGWDENCRNFIKENQKDPLRDDEENNES